MTMTLQKTVDIPADRRLYLYTSLAQGNQDEGLALLNGIVTKYPKTPAAYQAELFLGDFYAGQGNFNEALRFLLDANPMLNLRN